MANTYSKYEDKQDLNIDASVPQKNKCTASDLNYIKYQLPNAEAQIDDDYSVNMVVSKNLFNKNTVIGYTQLKNDGTTEASLTKATSQFMKVIGGAKYVFSATSFTTISIKIVEYDKNKNFIKYTNADIESGYTLTTDENTCFIRIDMDLNQGYLGTCQIELGETKTDYEPFVENKTIVNDNNFNDGVSVGSNNDASKRVNIIKSRNLFNKDDYKYVKAGFNASSTNLIPNDNATTIYIPCKKNTYYSIKKHEGYNLFVALSSVDPTTTSAIYGNTGNSLFNEEHIMTASDTKYLVVLLYTTGIDEITLQQALNGLMIEEGFICHDYEPYTTNSIQVDNETFTETLKIGTEVDDKSRVNFLHSRNLFDSTQGVNGYVNAQGGITSLNTSFVSDYIKLKSGKMYTISLNTTANNIGVALFNESKTMSSRQNNNNVDKITFTASSDGYIRFWIEVDGTTTLNATNIANTYNVQLQIGSQALPYEPYVVPSINVDGETIYQKPVVLWTNPTPTSSFAGQEITLNEDLENYSYYEILYLFSSGLEADIQLTTGRIETNKRAFLSVLASVNNSIAAHRRLVSSLNNNKITFSVGQTITTTVSTNNNILIPYKILGYK